MYCVSCAYCAPAVIGDFDTYILVGVQRAREICFTCEEVSSLSRPRSLQL